MVHVDAASLHSGLLVNLTLSGSANGTLRAYVSRYADIDPDDPAQAVYISEVPISGTFPNLQIVLGDSGFWFLWLRDDDGLSDPFPMDAVLLYDEWMTAVGKALTARVELYRPLLDAHLRKRFPDTTGVFDVVFGFANNKVNVPFVVVTKPALRPERVALGGVWNNRIEMVISIACTRASDETDETEVAANCGTALARVLNLPRHATLEIPGGCILSLCQATEVTAEMVPSPVESGYAWFSIAMVRWSGELLNTGL